MNRLWCFFIMKLCCFAIKTEDCILHHEDNENADTVFICDIVLT